MINLSVVIPTKDREDDLLKCVESISKQAVKPIEVLVVDDGLISKGVKEKIKNLLFGGGIPFKYFKKTKPSSSESRNLGAKEAMGEIILFIDDDIVLENDYIKIILEVWNRRWGEKRLAGISGVVTNIKEKSFIRVVFEKIFCLYSVKSWSILPWGFQTNDFKLKEEELADWIPSGLASFRKEIFNNYQFKQLQPGRVALEDFELCWQLKDDNYYFVVTPFARLTHKDSAVGRESSFLSGFKEATDRKIIFKIHAGKTVKNYFYFFMAASGCVLALFHGGHFKKGFGMIKGYLRKDGLIYEIKGRHNKDNPLNKHGADKKVSVVFFLPSLEVGGAERIVTNIVNNLDKKKYNVSLVLAEAKGDFLSEIEKNVPIIGLDSKGDFRLFFKLMKYIRNNEMDVLVSAFPRINIICTVAKIFSGKKTKIILTEHSFFSLLPLVARNAKRRFFARFLLPLLSKIIYPRADKIVCVSKGIADDLLNVIGCKEKFKIIYNPIVSNKIYELAGEPINKAALLGSNKYFIVSVGRLALRKDYPNLLEAFKLVVGEQSAQLVILGEGPEKGNLVRIVSKLGLSKNVTFMGVQKNPYKFMANADVFVLSSIAEGFPTVIVEAMICGTPVVSTDCKSGPAEIIENGENGLLVPVRDGKALAGAILKLLGDIKLRKKLSIEGRKISQKFSFENSIKEYENIFEEVLEQI